ncbi:MAG: hypothetical protein H3C31_04520 [Brumimicrobium sp.]|nr:hypothetical protein [Brumimicrobium sp.]MCO5268818.1 hypothetical protein [Brumimicrobium sp.]
MRVIDSIPHPRFNIQIYSYNSKYTIKIELGQFEQHYKIGEMDVMGIDEVKAMITTEFLNNCLKRFVEMREDWRKAFEGKNTKTIND